MESLIFDSALYDSVTGGIDFAADAFRVMLVGPDYLADKANHRRRSDVNDEIDARGYEAGGREVIVAVSQADGITEISLGGAIWDRATIRASGAVYYKSRGGAPADDELVAYIGFPIEAASSNGPFLLDRSRVELFEATV